MPRTTSAAVHLRFSAACLALAICFAPAPSASADAVDDYLNAEIARRHIPGVSLAVVQKGEVVKLGAYGKANLELDVSVTPRTVFQIQSMTKSFTSTAILLLVEEGKLSLDDPVGKHLEGTPEAWKGVTLRHLLSHTSGIKDFINEPTASIRLDVTEQEVLEATAPRDMNFQPGERYQYSNTNYHLLAMVIRKVTGKWYGDFLKERIFEPLGMADTRVNNISEVIPNRASGYLWRGGKLRNGEYVADSILAYGGGGIVSTAPDMAKFAAALRTEKLLKKSSLEQAWTGVKLNDGSTSSYGLGWALDRKEGHRSVGHGGGHMTGFTSYFAHYRDDDLTVIVLTNAGQANPGRIASRVAGLFVPSLAPQPTKPIEDKDPHVTALLRDIAGRVAEGRLESKPFTTPMWVALSAMKKQLMEESKLDGPLKSVELLARDESDDERSFRYRMTFANRTHVVTMTLNKEGKIAGLTAEEE
jgi:CubicO group peptidase (beta-lactamase class C family)